MLISELLLEENRKARRAEKLKEEMEHYKGLSKQF